MKLNDKLKTLPKNPGVYFHKDKTGVIIYVGKAAVLKNRVRQYFQNTKDMDIKTKALVSEIVDTDWIETDSEIDALFLEAEMVKRYMPRFNILLRDDKSLSYIRIDMNNNWPFISFTHNPVDDKAEYFGPYYNSYAIKKALRYLRRIFPYYTTKPTFARPGPENKKRMDLDDHLGLSPVNMTSSEYKANLRKLIGYIKGNRKKITIEIEKDMKKAAEGQNYELAAKLRNKLINLRELQQRIMFGDKEFLDISKDIALTDITELFLLKKIPIRIEGFDISHLGGTNVVASMVVFKNGASDRAEYRKFKMSIEKNDDFYNMNEVITRRFSDKNIASWGTPNLVLIDGGKGQLDAAIQVKNKLNLSNICFIGLAKKEEQIIVKGIEINEKKAMELGGRVQKSNEYISIDLPNSTHIIKLLQRIRNESHRFAVSYHTTLKMSKQTHSILDDIPGIGPKTKSKLIKKFGSINGIKKANESEIINVIGKDKAKKIAQVCIS